MEEKGIGRPSTYAPTISTILNREYVVKEGRALRPTPLGEVVTTLMKDKFQDIVDPTFTAQMEEQLDKVEQLLKLAGMYVPHDPAAARAQADAPAQLGKRRISVPILGRAAAGKPIEMIETSGDDLETDARPGDFVVIAVGNSMVEAGIQDGAQCLIRPQPTVENGEIALVAVGDGSTIKRFYKDDDGYRLAPCSPSHPVQYYDAGAPIRILGRFLKTID